MRKVSDPGVRWTKAVVVPLLKSHHLMNRTRALHRVAILCRYLHVYWQWWSQKIIKRDAYHADKVSTYLTCWYSIINKGPRTFYADTSLQLAIPHFEMVKVQNNVN